MDKMRKPKCFGKIKNCNLEDRNSCLCFIECYNESIRTYKQDLP